MHLKKKDLITAFILQLEKEQKILRAAALATHEAATNEESKAENEYDTRGLEASYLAGAQAKRVGEIDDVINQFRNMLFKDFAPDDPVANTALVKISLDGKPNTVLVLPKGGGFTLTNGTEQIQIVTPQSRLGETLMGLHVGDSAEFEVGPKIRECEILDIS